MRVSTEAFDSDVVVQLVRQVSSHIASTLILKLRITRCSVLEFSQLLLLSLSLVLLIVGVFLFNVSITVTDYGDELSVRDSSSDISLADIVLAVLDLLLLKRWGLV